jgi:uncharacterized protein (DUF342 family)
MGVDGIGITPPEPEEVSFTIGRGLELRPDGTVVVTRSGALMCDNDGVLHVVWADVVERERTDVLVQVDQRAMLAWIGLDAGEWITPENLRVCLNRAGVAFGLDEEVPAQAAQAAPERRVLELAHGKDAQDGEDARLELLVDEARRYQVDAYEHIDFHDLGRLPELKPGDPILRLHPATAGVPGMDVLGRVVRQRPGKMLELSQAIGNGVRVRVSDPLYADAAVQGVFRRNRQGRCTVEPLLVVEGDVDFRCGNIDTSLPVLIKGDVKKGFAVKSAGSVTVMGVVEDARVSVQGDLVVQGGILPGENRVKAHGDIVARYISSREVKGRNITVTAAITASRINATADVAAKEIAAGIIRATGTVTCDLLGNEGGQKTQVEVGINPFAQALFETAQREIKRLEAQVPAQKDRCRLIAHRVDQIPVGHERDDAVALLRQALQEYAHLRVKLAECEKIVADHLHNQDAALKAGLASRVVVRRMAFQGVEIRIAGLAHLDVWEAVRGPTFYYKDGMVAW